MKIRKVLRYFILTHDIPPFTIVGGIPARVLKNR